MSFTALQFVQNNKAKNSFVGVFRYVKTSGVKSTKDGELYGFVEISSEGNFPAERVAHIAWDGAVEGYMYSQTRSISESLKSGVQEFTRRLKDLMRHSEELEEIGIEVSLVIVSATKEGIYIANLGENEIFTYRGQKIINVVDILEKNSAQTAGFAVSKEDLVAVSTRSLLSENMHVLVGKNSKGEILKSLGFLGKTLTPNQGLFCISLKDEKEDRNNAAPKNENVKVKQEGERKEKKKSKVFRERFLRKIDGLKLKKVFGKISNTYLTVIEFFKKIFSPLVRFLKNCFRKIGSFLKGKFENKRWFKKCAAKVSSIHLRRKPAEVRIDGYKTKSLKIRRLKIVVLATLGIVIAVGGYQYARKQREVRDLHNQADEIFASVSGKIESAKSNLSVDTKEAETDIFTAGELLNSTPEGVSEEYLEKKGKLEQDILGVEDDLYRRIEVSLESFVGFFDEGTELTDIEYILDDSGNEILVITDKGTGSVWEVSIYSRSKDRMADNEGLVSSPEYVDIGNEGDIFVYDSNVGVLKASANNSGWGAFEKITGAGLKNIGIDNVKEFAVLTSSDNLYYLDTANSRVVKSVNYGTGYSSTVVTAINDEKFSNAYDFFADFSIYVLTSGNEGVLRYSAGTYVPVSIVGVNGELGELTCGDTSGTTDFAFYMFDSGSKRILKMEKPIDSYNDQLHPNELVLLNQYIYRGDNEDMWSDVKDIVIDKAGKYMYVLDGNNVWRVAL